MNNITQQIIDHSYEYAKDLLEDTGQCYPFGAFVDNAGQIHPLEFEISDKKNIPNNESVMWSLKKFCDTEIENNRIIAYGLTYEASVLLAEGELPVETFAIDIINPQDDELPVFYYPYELKNETIVMKEPFAVARQIS